MTAQRVIKGLGFQVQSPSRFVYPHSDGEISIEYLGRYIVGDRNRPRWLLKAGKQKVLSFSLQDAAETLSIALHNAVIEKQK